MPKKNLKKLNKYQRKLILDMVIGDGLIKTDGRLQIKHSIKQENYLKWKEQILNDAGIPTHIRYDKNISFDKRQDDVIILTTQASIAIKHMRHFLYRPYKFLFYPSLFKHLDDLSIAIWYMDDGSCNKYHTKYGSIHKGEVSLSTYTSMNVNQLIVSFFKERYNVDFKIERYSPNPKLTYISTSTVVSTDRFLGIVTPYIDQVPCMIYKLNNDIFLSDILKQKNLNNKDNAVMLNPEVGDNCTINPIQPKE